MPPITVKPVVVFECVFIICCSVLRDDLLKEPTIISQNLNVQTLHNTEILDICERESLRLAAIQVLSDSKLSRRSSAASDLKNDVII